MNIDIFQRFNEHCLHSFWWMLYKQNKRQGKKEKFVQAHSDKQTLRAINELSIQLYLTPFSVYYVTIFWYIVKNEMNKKEQKWTKKNKIFWHWHESTLLNAQHKNDDDDGKDVPNEIWNFYPIKEHDHNNLI